MNQMYGISLSIKHRQNLYSLCRNLPLSRRDEEKMSPLPPTKKMLSDLFANAIKTKVINNTYNCFIWFLFCEVSMNAETQHIDNMFKRYVYSHIMISHSTLSCPLYETLLYYLHSYKAWVINGK